MMLLLNNKRLNYDVKYSTDMVQSYSDLYFLPVNIKQPVTSRFSFERQRASIFTSVINEMFGIYENLNYLNVPQNSHVVEPYLWRNDRPRVLGSIEFNASNTLNTQQQMPKTVHLTAFAFLGGLFASLYVIMSIIMTFFRPWLLSLELVLAAPFRYKAKEEAIPGYDPKDLTNEQLEKRALKAIKHRKPFEADISDRGNILADRLLHCCLRPSRRTNLILGGAEEIRNEFNFHNYI